MGLFDKLRPKPRAEKAADPSIEGTYGSDELYENGELPLGWIGRHHKEIKALEEDFEAKRSLAFDESHSIDEKIAAFKRLIASYEAMKTNFTNLSGCHARYFEEQWLHCHNSRCDDFEYIDRCKEDLSGLLDNYDALKTHETLLPTLDADLWQYLASKGEILQASIYKDFDPALTHDIKDRLYVWDKEGRITRTKSGRSYLISCNRT